MITLSQQDLEEVLHLIGVDDLYSPEDIFELHLEWDNSYLQVKGEGKLPIRMCNEYDKISDR